MSVNKTHFFSYKTYAEIGYASLHKEYKSNLNKYIKSSLNGLTNSPYFVL